MERAKQPTEPATQIQAGTPAATKLVDLGAVTEETQAQTKVVITVTDGVLDYAGMPMADIRR